MKTIDWSQIKHFTRAEFGSAEGVDPDYHLVTMIEKARRFAGVPFVITSGIRTEAENDRVGGSPLSAHLTGHAADIRVTDSASRFEILQGVIEAGFSRVGIYDGHIHVDTSDTLPDNVCWTGKSR